MLPLCTCLLGSDACIQQLWRLQHCTDAALQSQPRLLCLTHRTASPCLLPAACSPHIRSFNERIAVDGGPIPASQLDSLAQRHAGAVEAAQAREAGALSHFEIVTALAYKHFQERQVGGGRLCRAEGTGAWVSLACTCC